MKLTELLDQIEHKKIRRSSWPEDHVIYADKNMVRKRTSNDKISGWDLAYVIEIGDLKATDWEVV